MGNITFTMIKPEAVKSKNIGNILSRIEDAGFRISAMKKTHLSINQAASFYKIHKSKPFYKAFPEMSSTNQIRQQYTPAVYFQVFQSTNTFTLFTFLILSFAEVAIPI